MKIATQSATKKVRKEDKNIFKILLKDKPLTRDFIAIKFTVMEGGRKWSYRPLIKALW